VRSVPRTKAISRGCQHVGVGDIGPRTSWAEALDGVETTVHLAARVHLTHDAATDPLAAFRQVNTHGTLNLARQASAAGVRRFIYLSSIKVNGEETTVDRPFAADDAPAPVDPYGISKWEAEQGLHRLARETGMEVVVIRPPLVYGPGVKANFLSLMKLVEAGLPLPLASLNNRRSFIFLDNLVDAVCTCIADAKADGKTYLVSDGEDMSTPDLIQRLAKAMGKPARLFRLSPWLLSRAARLPGRFGSLSKLVGSLSVDGSKIIAELGWNPPYGTGHGIRQTVAWYREK
jgi:nucleoside-diphosphate-sugar epimerase